MAPTDEITDVVEEPTEGQTTPAEEETDPALAEMITMVKALSDETDDSVIPAFLTFAGNAICPLKLKTIYSRAVKA